VFPLDTATHIAARALRLFALASAAALLFACAGAPVQEMSNARQTLAAAEQAQADKSAPAEMENARHYLDAAQAALDAGDYSVAREDALKARQAALRALGISQGQDVSGHSPP
jgi:outer membrane biogenesis lipoprotein LolB